MMDICLKVLFAAFFAALLLPQTAFAYLDPGSGSVVVQAIVAAFFGALLSIKLFWHRIVGFFKGSKKSQDDSN